MALKVTPDNLIDEVRAAEEFRDRFLEGQKELIKRYHAGYYRTDSKPNVAVTENHAYEYVSIMLPSLVYDNPRCRIQPADPNQWDEMGQMTFGQFAKGLEITLNRWSEDSEVAEPLLDAAVDFFFSYAVLMVTTEDQPGFNGAELVPQRPLLLHLPPEHFSMDATATTHNPMKRGGPRLMQHLWKADLEDLMNDPLYDHSALDEIAADNDLEKYDFERQGLVGMPDREEVLGWEIWVPEIDLRKKADPFGIGMDEPGFNGTIFTLAVGLIGDSSTKRARFIRPPRPASCPPWGPYVIIGDKKVPKSPYPLSPLAAVAEQAVEVNAHTTAAAEDARRYKKFVAYDIKNAADGSRLKTVRHGDVLGMDSAKDAKTLELGGVSDSQYKYNMSARERLDRASGLSDAMRGNPDADVTATAEARAAAGTDARLSGMKRSFRRGVAQVFKTAAWHVFYGEDQIHSIGADGMDEVGASVFYGGVEGRRNFNFFDMSLSIDPLSLEHTDQAMLQRRILEALNQLKEVAPIMMQTPYIRWSEPLRAVFESLNVGEADHWIDDELLAVYQGLQLEGQVNQQLQDQNAAAAEGLRMDGNQQGGGAAPQLGVQLDVSNVAREYGAIEGANAVMA